MALANIPEKTGPSILIVKNSGYSKNTSGKSMSGIILRVLVGFLTGHCQLSKHMWRFGLDDNSRCRFCEEAKKTPEHLFIQNPTLCLRFGKESDAWEHSRLDKSQYNRSP